MSANCDTVSKLYDHLLLYIAHVCACIIMYLHMQVKNICRSVGFGKHVYVIVFVKSMILQLHAYHCYV